MHGINYYPKDCAIAFRNTYPLDSDLSGGQRFQKATFEQLRPDGQRYLTFEQLGPEVKSRQTAGVLSLLVKERE